MHTINATDVRKNWSAVCDDAVRNRPVFVKRTRDYMVIASNETLKSMLEDRKFNTTLYEEDDGSVTIASNDLDLTENAPDRDIAMTRMAEAILDYAEEYYSEYNLYSKAPNRRAHLPFVFKAIILGTPEAVKEEMVCRNGKI